MAVLAIVFFLFILGIVVLVVASYWRIFEKAGQPGWAAIIPIYNLYILLKVVGKPGWWILMMFIPLVNYVFLVWTYNMLSKSFGRDEGFTVGLVLLNVVFLPILAFSDSRYLGPYGDGTAFAAQRNTPLATGTGFDFDQNRLSGDAPRY